MALSAGEFIGMLILMFILSGAGLIFMLIMFSSDGAGPKETARFIKNGLIKNKDKDGNNE